MLILRRREDQWVEITHRESGNSIRVRVCNIRARYPGQVDLVLDDEAYNFVIQRPERAMKMPAVGEEAVATEAATPG